MSKYTEGRVRDFKLNREDAAKLADCFNSFDDSDSWPGGFTHGNPLTAEQILEVKQKSADLRVMVAYDGEKIVGHCNLCDAESDPEAAYVGILGVRPDYQGRGFGKALLIEATETAVKLGKKRIDLHTWAGNLKAMPLYKRVGYNWVPNTRVLMESYIPAILSCDLFKKFFERYYWFDVLKREIKQEPDEIVRKGIPVYLYHFEGENGDSLDVTIDRWAKGICAFKLTFDGETIEASVFPTTNTGYIGIGEIPVTVSIKNNWKKELEVDLKVTPKPELFVELKEHQLPQMLASGEEVAITGKYRIAESALHHNQDEEADVKVKTFAEWQLKINGEVINLFSGIVPQEAISVTANPPNITVVPGEPVDFGIVLENKFSESIRGCLKISSTFECNFSWKERDFELKTKDTQSFQLQFNTSADTGTTVIPIDISVNVQLDGYLKEIKKTRQSVAVIGPNGAVAYENLGKALFLETERFRIKLAKGPVPVIRLLEDKVTGKTLRGWLLMPLLGYPFPPEGGEWTREDYTHQILNSSEIASVSLIRDSTERKGLRATMTYRVDGNRQELLVDLKIENIGDSILTNLGVITTGWGRGRWSKLIIPIMKDLYELTAPEWGGENQLPEKVEYYDESWLAVVDEERKTQLGFIWNTENLVKVRPVRDRGITSVEYKIGDLEPKSSKEFELLRIIVGQDWREVRRRWAALQHQTIEKKDVFLRSDLEVAIVPAGRKDNVYLSGAPVLVDGAKDNQMELRVQVIHANPITATLNLKMPSHSLINGKSEFQAEIGELSIDKPFVERVIISCTNAEEWLFDGGKIELRFMNRIARFPLTVIKYDSKVKVNRKREYGKCDYQETEVGTFRIAASAKYEGGLVAYGPVNAPSVFYDTFPDAKPFIWFDRFYSGMTPKIFHPEVWDWMTGLEKEKWKLVESEEGPWVGYRVSSLIKHVPQVEDIELHAEYMLLRGAPIMRAKITAINKGPHWRQFSMGFGGVVRPNGKAMNRVHLVRDNKKIVFEPTQMSQSLQTSAKEGWIAIEDPETHITLGAITPYKNEPVLGIMHFGEAGQQLQIFRNFGLMPDGKASVVLYLLVTDDPTVIERLKLLKE